MNISKFLIRASYPNYFMVKLYADCGRDIFEKQNEREGNKPGTVIYTLDDDDTKHEIAPRWYDIFYLLKNSHLMNKSNCLEAQLYQIFPFQHFQN